MPYIPMTNYESAPEEVRARYDSEIAKHGRITNMKRTLLHAPKAFDVYMEWYALFDLCREFVEERALMLFSYAISEGNRCLVCGTFFRKVLIDSGDDPDNPQLNEEESLLVDLGLSISEDPHNIDPGLYDAVAARYSDAQRVLLLSFAGMMAATNLFNTIAQVDLDEALYEYRRARPYD